MHSTSELIAKVRIIVDEAHRLLNPGSMVDELTYASYVSNRKYSPSVTPERWERLFGSTVPAMEERFQRESERYSINQAWSEVQNRTCQNYIPTNATGEDAEVCGKRIAPSDAQDFCVGCREN